MRLALACLALVAALGTATAAEPLSRGKIAAPQQPAYQPPPWTPAPAEPAYKAHNLYFGGVLGHTWGIVEREGEYGPFVDGTNTFSGAIMAGYLWRPDARLGLGVEVDYTFRDLGDLRLEDGTASVRGRLGVFVAPGTFLYGTAGVAEAMADAPLSDDLRRGLVVGGGVEKDVTAALAVRAEVLHYRHAGDYFEWGEEGSTQARVGLLMKF